MRFERQDWLRNIALCALLTYPVMAIKWLPLGGGARYMSVLAGPMGLLMMMQMPRDQVFWSLRAAGRWTLPFLPFVLAWGASQLWHAYDPADWTPLSRLFWGAVLYATARLVGLSHFHLALGAAIGSFAYGVVALVEVYGLGRQRAWGGTYENRFGQYAIWLAGLCWMHLIFARFGEYSSGLRRLLILASLFGIIGSVLSGARGSLTALPVILLIVLLHSRQRRQAWLVVAGGGCAVACSMLYPPISERFALVLSELQAYFEEPEFHPTSIGIRLELARISGLMLLEHPWFGPGLTSIVELFKTHPGLGTPTPELLTIPGFHNDWSQFIGLGGGVLLAGFGATLAFWFRETRRDPYRQSFLGMALIFGLSEIFFCNKLGLSLFVVVWALYAAAGEKARENAHEDA